MLIAEITATELQTLLQTKPEDVILLDVREPHEYEAGNIGGYLIPLGLLSNRLAELDKTKTIIVHCRSGFRSQQALAILQAAKFEKLKHFSGGILAWVKEIDSSLVSN